MRFDYELKNQIEVDRNSPNSNTRESANWFADGRGRCRQRAVTLKDKEEGEIEFTSKICRKNQNLMKLTLKKLYLPLSLGGRAD